MCALNVMCWKQKIKILHMAPGLYIFIPFIWGASVSVPWPRSGGQSTTCWSLFCYVGIRDQTQDGRPDGLPTSHSSRTRTQHWALCSRPCLHHSSTVASVTYLGPHKRKEYLSRWPLEATCLGVRVGHRPGPDPLKPGLGAPSRVSVKVQHRQTLHQALNKEAAPRVSFVKSLHQVDPGIWVPLPYS